MVEYELKVKALLLGICTMYERQYYKGDFDAVDELFDFRDAVKEADLTDRQSSSLSMYYVYGYKRWEIGNKLEIQRQVVDFHIKSAIRKIAKVYKQQEQGEQ